MRESEPSSEEATLIKVDTYKGYNVYTKPEVPKEAIANMSPDSENNPVAIAIRPDAYEILKSRPDFLERIYDHELRHHMTAEGAEHGGDRDILEFLRDNGYDFGDFKF